MEYMMNHLSSCGLLWKETKQGLQAHNKNNKWGDTKDQNMHATHIVHNYNNVLNFTL